jgi:hypothetical protein
VIGPRTETDSAPDDCRRAQRYSPTGGRALAGAGLEPRSLRDSKHWITRQRSILRSNLDRAGGSARRYLGGNRPAGRVDGETRGNPVKSDSRSPSQVRTQDSHLSSHHARNRERLHKRAEPRRQAENRAQVILPATISCAIEVTIRRLRQSAKRILSVGARELVQCRQSPRRCHDEDRTVPATARRRCAIEVTVVALHQRTLWIAPIGPAERVQRRQLALRRDLEDSPAVVASARRRNPAA